MSRGSVLARHLDDHLGSTGSDAATEVAIGNCTVKSLTVAEVKRLAGCHGHDVLSGCHGYSLSRNTRFCQPTMPPGGHIRLEPYVLVVLDENRNAPGDCCPEGNASEDGQKPD